MEYRDYSFVPSFGTHQTEMGSRAGLTASHDPAASNKMQECAGIWFGTSYLYPLVATMLFLCDIMVARTVMSCMYTVNDDDSHYNR